jgi:hypothetical protein
MNFVINYPYKGNLYMPIKTSALFAAMKVTLNIFMENVFARAVLTN